MQFDREVFSRQARRLVDALGDPVPDFTPAVRAEADRIAEGEIVAVRSPVLWHRVGLEGIDWQCKACPNQEMAEMALLRFSFLPALASAFRATGDERYARAARHYMESIIRDLHIRNGWTPAPFDGATQYDIRIGAWLQALPALLAGQAFDDAFLSLLLEAVRTKLAYLSGHVYVGRNIRALHGEVLLLSALRLPFLPRAAEWREQGISILNEEFHRQILADGAHVEAAPHYHECVMNGFYALWRLARAMPELGLAISTEAMSRMFDYALASHLPNGAVVPMHDSRCSPASGSFPNPSLEKRREFRQLAGLAPDEMPPLRRCFPDAGQVYLRDGWSPQATYVAFDATSFGSYHWHPSRNAIHLFAHGRSLLTDPGYPFSKPDFPAYGAATRHHNTLNLNGWSQARTSAKLRYRGAPGYDLVEGLYEGGYWPFTSSSENTSAWATAAQSHGEGMYGEHHRTLLWVHGRCLVVIDNLYTTSAAGRKPRLESVWQLSEGPAVIEPEQRRAVTGHRDANLLMLFPLMPAGMQMALHEGERDPERGWLAIDWGERYTAAPMIRCYADAHDPWNTDLVTVLVPFAGPTPPTVAAEAVAPSQVWGELPIGRLTLRWGDGTVDEVHWGRRLERSVRAASGLDTDAALVHLQRNLGGDVTRGLVADGSYLNPYAPKKRPRLEVFAFE